MTTGIINTDFETIISLSICGSDGKTYTQDVIVDTGFNGWLSLPPDLIGQLNLKWKRQGLAILGYGSECVFNDNVSHLLEDVVIPIHKSVTTLL
jgi:predicted aspartyl protease